MTMAIGLEKGHVKRGERVGMLGIGSGINCLMLAVEWQRSLVGTADGRVVDSAAEVPPRAYADSDLARP